MIVKYEVRYWDEVEKKELDEKGLVAGADETSCINNIKKWYGKDNVSKFSIEYFLDVDAEDIFAFNAYTKEELKNILT